MKAKSGTLYRQAGREDLAQQVESAELARQEAEKRFDDDWAYRRPAHSIVNKIAMPSQLDMDWGVKPNSELLGSDTAKLEDLDKEWGFRNSEITYGQKKPKKFSNNPIHMDDDSEVSLP